MSILPHTIVGAVAGSFSANPLLSTLYGFGTHFLLDIIPHFDPEISSKKKKTTATKLFYAGVILADVGISLLVLALLWPFPNLFWGAIGGILPDVDNFLQYKFKAFPLLSRIGINVHDEGSLIHNKLTFKSYSINLIVGIIEQSLICLLGLYYLNSQLNII